jgi:hypothetical protein
MTWPVQAPQAGGDSGPRWLRYTLILLLAEKVIQHIFVSLALWFDWLGIAATVVVSPTVLAVLGSIAAALFALALWGVLRRRKWAYGLTAGLAVVDIAGEFVAQGTLAITLNVSFLVAIALLMLVLAIWRRSASSEHQGQSPPV